MISFTDPGWLAEVRAWIASHVEIAGEIEQPHIRAWATVLRVPTEGGPVWFKASRDAFASEAALLERLTPLAPELLPQVLAARPSHGWLLLADGGERAREHPIDWRPLMRRYAELQIAAAPLAAELIELGVVDRRAPDMQTLLPSLSRATAEELAARLSGVDAALARLAASPLPPTIDHGDLHDGNVFSRGGEVRILDWGDAAVSHPFMTLTVEEDPAARAGYLAAWERLAPRDRLLRDLEDVLFLRYLVRALNQLRIEPYDRDVAIEGVELRVRLFLDGES